MSLPGNGVFVVQGEMSILVTAMRRGARWSSHSHQDEDHDVLLKSFHDLKALLNRVEDLKLLNPNIFLEPFLEIIRSEETTGPVTSLALSSVQKFLSYGLIDPEHDGSAMAVESIASAVTKARFVGTDAGADALVLLRILHTLRALLMSPPAHRLTDNAVCDIALSCFRICFESRLNELLRRTAELVLRDMVQLLFIRLPQFTEDNLQILVNMRKIKMNTNSMDQTRNKKKGKYGRKNKNPPLISEPSRDSGIQFSTSTTSLPSLQDEECAQTPPENRTRLHIHREDHLTTTPLTPTENIVDMQGSISQVTPTSSLLHPNSEEQELQDQQDPDINESSNLLQPDENFSSLDTNSMDSLVRQDSVASIQSDGLESHEYVNPRGVRFTPQSQEGNLLIPYGIVCVQELFRFLIALCNPLDKQNNEIMIHLGLTLLTVALEVGADSIGKYNSLLPLCKDELCRNLFSLLSAERISIFAADLQVSFLLFESLRTHLKFQLEFYLTKLIEIIISDSIKVTYEHKEIALDNIVQLWRISGLVTELYLNYDCDFYCTNLFEDLTKLLAKNAFPVTAGVYHTHLLSLDALLTIIESIRYNCSIKLEKTKEDYNEDDEKNKKVSSRQKVSECIPSHEDLKEIKDRKRWLPQGTEYFNTKPKKGIQFLQEHGILKSELDPDEVVHFLRENPNLDKKMIGEYISSRNNLQVLEVFVKSFDFTEMRIDEALRLYLETFRLPGEAPLISLLMEHFAEHWHKCNGEPFANADAAFTLAYAVIMLNVDQHNHNVKRQNIPMTPDDFKRNVKKVNGGNDFDQDMLDEIYSAIKNEEIVMPAEQTGIVRENYLWKVLLRRGNSKDGDYIHVQNGTFDRDLFNLIWGPTIAALSFVFDKSEDALIYQRAIKGFEKCAFISSQFNITSNLDTLILSLCKFTQLNSQQKQTFNVTLQFASNEKAQLAFKTVLKLVHLHGDNLRDGWVNIFDLFLALYTHKLLPKPLLEADDFTEPSGKISLVCETISSQKTETGLFSSFYSYMLSSEAGGSRIPSPEEQELIEYAQNFIKEINLEQVVTESKFLQIESLLHLIDALINFSKGPDGHQSLGTGYNEHITVFFLELLLKVVIQNRDRVTLIWKTVQDHIYSLVMGAATCDYQYLLERSIMGLLRLAIRLMRNEELSPIILQSLRMLLLLKPVTLLKTSRQISFGLFELLKTSAQNIHTDSDWKIVFTLLECIGAGAHAPKPTNDSEITDQGTKSDGEAPISSGEEEVTTERGYTSDSELTRNSPGKLKSPEAAPLTRAISQQTNGWILVTGTSETDIKPVQTNQETIVLERRLGAHNPAALLKCCESLAFLVRDVAHITPYNFEDCVRCIRTFVEASLYGRRSRRKSNRSRKQNYRQEEARRAVSPSGRGMVRSQSPGPEDDDSDLEDLPSGYHQVSIQLLDLMHTLHTRTAHIFRWWAEEHGDIAVSSLWPRGWCPLLQGIARLCCDFRKQVRMSAITYLQRALLMPDLQSLTGPEWEACFHRVLFPLLSQLLENPQNATAQDGLEEARMRAATVLSKVFLHHLTPLLTLSTFTQLWLHILDYMDKYMHAGNSDLLFEAIPESLKNMLLVMDSAKVFNELSCDDHSQLWNITWDRIHTFLPNLKDELFKSPNLPELPPQVVEETIGSNEDLTNIQASQLPPPPPPVLHDVVNATRNSIILQPPAMDNIASPLFAHLGQMVSTPIGAPNSMTQSQLVPPYSSIPPPPKSPAHVPSPSHQIAPPATAYYPVLYSTPHTGLPEPVQLPDPVPQPLYTDYINNPYNIIDNNKNPLEEESVPIQPTQNMLSNYFYTNTSVPPGSEILFGNESKEEHPPSNIIFYNPATMTPSNIPITTPDLK